MLDEFFYCFKPQRISSSKGIYHFLARKLSLKLVSDMPDSNRNWKNRYFLSRGQSGCAGSKSRPTCPTGLITHGGLSRSLVSLRLFVSLLCLVLYLTQSFRFLASIRPEITDEQENFLWKVWAIPLEERKWKDLVTHDTLHTFYSGPEQTLIAQRLHASSQRCKFPYPSAFC